MDECHHGLTRRGFIGRGAAVGGALLVESTVLAGVARADEEDPARAVTDVSHGAPQTRLARAVAEFAASSYPPFLAHHCERSFDLALLIAAANDLDVDREVLYAGILLHDLGLTPQFHSSTVRFEVASADAARSFVREYGMSVKRADEVWDVVALHGTGGIAAP